MKMPPLRLFGLFISLTILGTLLPTDQALAMEPLFPNSVASNSLDFIRPGDDARLVCIDFDGQERAEMPDKRGGDLFVDRVAKFLARFDDGSIVPLWVHPDVSTPKTYAEMAAEALGDIPAFMRFRLDHIVIHEGNETAFAESLGNFFVLYTKNMDKRRSNNDLQETMFHESVHATLEVRLQRNRRFASQWQKAQRTDPGYITQYAQDLPQKEDLPESALFAWALFQHPGRLPARIEARVTAIMPHRLGLLNAIFEYEKNTPHQAELVGCASR